MDDATVVSSPSFDAMLEERGERITDEPPASASKELDPFAATVSSPSYDSRLEAMGLPVPEDEPAPEPQPWGNAAQNDPGVPKTMVLSPQQWGLPAQTPQQPQAHPAPQPHPAPQGHPAAQAHPPQSAPWAQMPHASPAHARPPPAKPASSRMSATMMFLISAGATLVVCGTCAAGILLYLLLRS